MVFIIYTSSNLTKGYMPITSCPRKNYYRTNYESFLLPHDDDVMNEGFKAIL